MPKKKKHITRLNLLSLIVLLFNLSFCYAQDIELELKKLQDKINTTKNDSIKIQYLLDLYEYYYVKQNNKDSMIAVSHRTNTIAKYGNHKAALYKVYSNLGNAFRLKRNLDSSLYYNNLAYEMAEQLNNKNLISEALLSLGSHYVMANDLSEASKHLIEGMEIAENENNTSNMAKAYYKLSYAFGVTNNITKEKYYLDKAYNLAINKTTDLTEAMRSSIYTAKMYYFERQRYKDKNNKEVRDSLQFYINECYAYGKTIDNPTLIVSALTLQGKILQNEYKLDLALKKFEEALSYKNRINTISLMNIYLNMADMYLKDNKAAKALQIKDSILSNVDTEPNYYRKGEIYRSAFLISESAGKPKLALDYYEKMTENFNKAEKEKQIKDLNNLEAKYKNQKKDTEIANQKLENETLKRKAVTNYFTFGIIGLVIIGVLGFMYFKKKNKALLTELDLATTKATLHRSQLNPHFVSNSINAIYPFLYDKTDPNKAAAYLSDLSQMIRSILDSTFETTWTIKEELDFIKQYCKIQELKMDYPLRLNINCEDGLENILIPSLLMQPFIENSFVHGFSETQTNAKINISITQQDRIILIKITDNGDSVTQTKSEHKSRSTEITKQRIYSTYGRHEMPKDFLNYGKTSNNTYQVSLKLPHTK